MLFRLTRVPGILVLGLLAVSGSAAQLDAKRAIKQASYLVAEL